MNWFDEQLKKRKNREDEIFESSFMKLADSVLGNGFSSVYLSKIWLSRRQP